MATLQEHIDCGDTIYAFHRSLTPLCNHSAALDLAALAARLGPDFDVNKNLDRFLRMLRCSKCHGQPWRDGKGKMSIVLTPSTAPKEKGPPIGLEAGATLPHQP